MSNEQRMTFNKLFDGKNVVVTGGNGGIGRAIGLSFAQAGATVLLIGRNIAKGKESVQFLADQGYLATFHSVDLANAQAVTDFYAEFKRTHNALHVLINCAGAGESRGGSVQTWVDGQTLEDVEQRWTDMANSNLRSAYLMSTLGAAQMPSESAIVNITSTASIHGNYGLYSTMKAGAEGLTRSLAVELASRGIRVNAISPGWIQTANTLPNPDDSTQKEWARQTSLLGRMGKPAEIAAASLFLASSQAAFITGETLRVDGGLTIIDPTAESWRTVKE